MKHLLILVAIAASTPALADTAPQDAGVALVDAGAAPAGSVVTTEKVTFTVDPNNPLGSVSTGWDIVKQDGWFWGGMAVLFGLGTFIVKKADEDHWLGNDHVLPICVAVLGVLGAVINAHFGAGSWLALPGVVAAGIALILQKPAPAQTASK